MLLIFMLRQFDWVTVLRKNFDKVKKKKKRESKIINIIFTFNKIYRPMTLKQIYMISH